MVRRLLPLLLLFGCRGCEPEPLPRTAIVLVLDGVRVDEFSGDFPSDLTGVTGEAHADETWAALTDDATIVRAAINPGITVTAPAHAALVTGREEAYANFPIEDAGEGLYLPEVPTIFEEARDQLGLGDGEVLFLANTELLMGVTGSLYPGFAGGATYDIVMDDDRGAPITDDAPVIDALLARLDEHPRLVVVNLHDADRAGHYGEGDAYVEDVDKLDGLVADFWATLEAERPELVESLLLVVTADHGRHRHDDLDGWHGHGDSCTGCREVPLLLAGGGIDAGERHDRVLTIDIAPTLAAWLGVELPWAEGLPYVEAFEALDATARSGGVDLVRDGDREATREWRDDRDARSVVVVDGIALSTPGIHAAEAPSLIAMGTGARACFREIDLAADADFLPWRPRCLAETDGAWVDIGFPDSEASPTFRVAFAERDGALWAAWPHNPNGGIEEGEEGGVGLHLAAWDPDTGWGARFWAAALFPTDVAVVATTRGLVAAVGTGLGEPDYRYTRRVRVVPIALGDVRGTDPAVDLPLESLLGPGGRTEHPALTADGDHVRIALLGHTRPGDALVATLESLDGGLTWSDPVALPDAGPPFPHLAPAWDGDAAVWAVAPPDRDGEAQLCRAMPGETGAACVGVTSPRVQSFAVQDGVATVVVDAGAGAWERVVVGW